MSSCEGSLGHMITPLLSHLFDPSFLLSASHHAFFLSSLPLPSSASLSSILHGSNLLSTPILHSPHPNFTTNIFPRHHPTLSSSPFSSYTLCPFIIAFFVTLLQHIFLYHLCLLLCFSLLVHLTHPWLLLSFIPVLPLLFFQRSVSSSSNLPGLPSSYTCLTLFIIIPLLLFLTCLPHLSWSPSSCISSFIFLPCSHFLWSHISECFTLTPSPFLFSFLLPPTRPSTHPYLDRERHVPEQGKGAAGSREDQCALLPSLFCVFHLLPPLPHGCARHPRLSGRRVRGAVGPQTGRRWWYSRGSRCWRQHECTQWTPAPVSHHPEHHRRACSLYRYHDCRWVGFISA